MIYSNSWAFFHIPKCGGTNFTWCAREHYSENDLFEPAAIMCSRSRIMHQPLWWWQKHKYIPEDIPIYAIARNPYARAASFWNFINVRREESERISFKDFWMTESPIDTNLNGAHWKKTTTFREFLTDRHGNFNTVKVFKLETELPLLEEQVGFDITSTKHYSYAAYDDYTVFYDDDIQNFIFNTFKDDFSDYNYSPELKNS